MQEYKDGTLGHIQEAESLLNRLLTDHEELERTRALHFGTRAELLARKMTHSSDADLQQEILARISKLEQKLDLLLIHLSIPTPGEIITVQNLPPQE